MTVHRKTISNVVAIEGVGLHSGIYTTLELQPANAGSGITFIRADLRGLRIPALQASTTALDHATSVGRDDVSIGTVEHVLSAIVAAGISDIDILLDGPEIPIIDGSALPFVHLIDAAGVTTLDQTIEPLRITRPVSVRDGAKTIEIVPSSKLIIHYKIDFDHPAIGKETFRFELGADNFTKKIAPARTFGFLRDVDKLRAAGLARGGSVENCIVLDESGITNGPLRFRDEFVRHKVLDLLGDLALLGRPLIGEIFATRGGHALHSQLVAEIIRTFEAGDDQTEPRHSDQSYPTYA